MAFEWSHLDTSFGALIRSGAGIIGMVLGGFILATKPRTRGNLSLGAFFVLDGLGYIVFSLAGGFLEFPHKELVVPVFTVTPVLSVLAASCLLAYGWPEVRRLRDSPLAAALGALAFVTTAGLTPFLIFVLGERQDLQTFGSKAGVVAAEIDAAAFSFYVGVVALIVLAFVEDLRRSPGDARARARLPLVGMLLMAGVTTAVSVNLAFAANQELLRVAELGTPARWAFIVAACAYLPIALWPLRVGPLERAPGAVVAVTLVALAAATVEFLLLRGDFIDQGFGGVVSLVGLAGFAYALFRLDLLGVPVPRPRAGSLAALGLAALFITAQVAQNFLSDGLGLLWGGVVAGIVVFAAGPVQRRMERSTQAPGLGVAAKYRRLVETAWTDGKLGANERLLLAESRRQLGLDAETATAIDEDVARHHASPGRGGKGPGSHLRG